MPRCSPARSRTAVAVAPARPRGGARAAVRTPPSRGNPACRTRSGCRPGRRRRGRSRRRRTTSRRRGGRRARGRRPTPSSTRTQMRLAGRSLAERQLGEGGGVGVVDDDDREVEPCREVGGEREVGPAEVGGRGDDAVVVDDAGAGDADAEQRSFGVGDELAADLPDQVAAARPVLLLRSYVRRTTTLPARLTMAPAKWARSERSRHSTWRPSASTSTSVAGLPTPPVVLSPSSSTTPSSMRSRMTADTDARVRPVILARSARDSGPSRCNVRSKWLRFARLASSGVAIRFVCLVDKQIGCQVPPTLRGVVFTTIPVVDLGRWHGGPRRACRRRRRGAPDLSRDRLLPARRPRRARRRSGAATSSCCRRSSPSPRTSRPASTSAGRATSGAGSVSAPS